jgi:UDP:flavonoid glycosyltransferase YjiC (YdhE family)
VAVRVLLGCSLGGLGHLRPVAAASQALARLGHNPLVLVPPALTQAADEAGLAFRVGGEPPRALVEEMWDRLRAGPP